MESPIDQRIWKWMFHGTAAFFTLRVALSLYNQRRESLSTLSDVFKELKQCKTADEQIPVLQAIYQELQEEARQRKGNARLSAYAHASALVKLLKLTADGSNAATVEVAIKVIVRVFGGDADGRTKLHEVNGFRMLMSVLSESHRLGLRRLMEASAAALCAVTEVDDNELHLPTDVPAGTEGAYSLTKFPSTVKMLRILDPNGPIVFLNALTGIFSNLAALRSGANAIGPGTDGVPGVEYFLRLLEHGNQGIVEHAAVTIRYLTRAGFGQDVVCSENNVARIASVFDVNRDPKITSAVLTIILIMIDGDHRKEFLQLVEKTDILSTLFQVWCRAQEKMVRDRAEFLIHLLDRTEVTVTIRRLLEANRTNIMERKQKDEEARRKQMQQMKQQQMMQQMMMQEMGMGGGGGMDMMMGE
jgi:rRNA-processing protein FCF1